jgi:hypothetical protein
MVGVAYELPCDSSSIYPGPGWHFAQVPQHEIECNFLTCRCVVGGEPAATLVITPSESIAWVQIKTWWRTQISARPI